MKSLNLSTFENKVDFSQLNLDKDKSKHMALLFSYGANVNFENLFDRLKDDWNRSHQIDKLEEWMDLSAYLLGVYRASNRQLMFNKEGASGPDAFNYANVQYRPGGEAYGTVMMVPKSILFDPASRLNRSEGCYDIHNVANPSNHYWLRQVVCTPYVAPGQPLVHPKHNGSDTINSVWMYEASPFKIGDEAIMPKSTYVKNIIRGLEYNGTPMVPNSYLDYLKLFIR